MSGTSPLRVAFPLIDPRLWRGGYNYLLNLFEALHLHAPGQLTPVLVCAETSSEETLAPLSAVPGVEIVRDRGFDPDRRRVRLLQALIAGRDPAAARVFAAARIDLAFESAAFFGWRARVPALAWMPDFQHRALPDLFSPPAWWRRELGFRAAIAAGRRILLSSEAARTDFLAAYACDPRRVSVVRFAVSPEGAPSAARSREIARGYALPDRFFYLPNQVWAHKNHALVVDALARLPNRDDLIVVWSGVEADQRDPGHGARLEQRIAAAGLGSRLRRLGVIPRDHVLGLMRASAALINPSRFEGWSTTVEEAKALGTPLLLSDLAVHREQAADLPRTGFFDPDSPDQLAALLDRFEPPTSAARAEIAAAAALRAKASVARFAEAFLAAARLAADRPQGAPASPRGQAI